MRHVETLVAQLGKIIADGVERGEFSSADPHATARAIFDATARFHNPAHAAEWADIAASDAAFERVWQLIVAALVAPIGRRPIRRQAAPKRRQRQAASAATGSCGKASCSRARQSFVT